MGLTSVMNTALSGLSTNQAKLDVVGNNITNVNTLGFKASSLNFETQFSQSFSLGTAADPTFGGTNPIQVGLGTKQASITKNFADGSRQVTGVNTDLAMEGDGFFVLQNSEQTFTRDGSFKLNSQNKLVNGDGLKVQGYSVDSNFNILPGVLGDVNIPIGGLTVAQATTNASFDGNLDSGGQLPTHASVNTFDQPLFAAGSGSTPSATPPDPSASGTLLTDVVDASNVPYFQAGDVITVQGQKGLRGVAAKTLTVGSGTTLNDYMSFMQGALGINTGAGANGLVPETAGVSTTSASSNSLNLVVTGNIGADNDISLKASDISISRGGGTVTPFTVTKNQAADGESVFTSMSAFDSLGTSVNVNVTASLVSADSTGTTWRYYAESPGGTASGALTNQAVAMGTLKFNNFGQLTTTTNPNVTIDRSGTGAVPQLAYKLDFSAVTALSGTKSQLANTLQDGSAKGTLTNFSISADGQVVGAFSNGLNRTVAQIAVATFRNNQGLVDRGNNTYLSGANSGVAVISPPGTLSAGKIVSGALEQSNVDLSGEFVNLIGASTGFSAASRVITTGNQLLQDLLSIAR